jgi:hypothetical protein
VDGLIEMLGDWPIVLLLPVLQPEIRIAVASRITNGVSLTSLRMRSPFGLRIFEGMSRDQGAPFLHLMRSPRLRTAVDGETAITVLQDYGRMQ